MIFVIGLLTVALVVNCLLLILLVLIQLPKKDAGAGLAFGGAATDALFGAGSGNVLTKATKYGTVTFFVLLLLIGFAQNSYFRPDASDFIKAVDAAGKETLIPSPAPSAPSAPTSTAPSTVPDLQSLTLTNAAPDEVP